MTPIDWMMAFGLGAIVALSLYDLFCLRTAAGSEGVEPDGLADEGFEARLRRYREWEGR